MSNRMFDPAAPVRPELVPARQPDAQEAEINHIRYDPLRSRAAPAAGLPQPQAHAAALRQASGGRLARAADGLLQLQRQHGNNYVQRVIHHASQPATGVPVVQAKLLLGAPGDRYEREADSVARQLGAQRLPDQARSRGPAAERNDLDAAAEPVTKPVASHGNGGTRAWPELEASITRARAGGRSLAGPVLKPMEQALGADFRRVRVHQDTESDELCQTIAARAFTVGNHIFVRNGERVGRDSSGRHLLAHELAHVVQQQRPAAPPRDLIQAFWVSEGGTYRWVSDRAKKQRYVKTAETRSTFGRPTSRAVRVDPWGPGTQLHVDPAMGFTAEDQGALEASVVDDLKKIRRTDVGAQLLVNLATQLGGRTTIQPQEGIRGPVTQTEETKRGLRSTIVLTPGQLDAAAALADQGIRVKEAPWNPSPSDVVLLHELLHAYHNLNGTRATGPVAAEQAIHPGDAGVAMSEYQVVGLDTLDGDPQHQFAAGYFTENTYRSQTNRPHRDTYTPRREAVPKQTVKKKVRQQTAKKKAR